jgi:hypothetical protein
MTVRPRRRLLLLLLLTFVGTASCAKALDISAAVGDELAQKFGECPLGGEDADFSPPVEFLGIAERWMEIDSIPSGVSVPTTASSGRTVEIDLGVKKYDPATDSFPGNAAKAPIAIHTSMLPGAAWALSEGGSVFLALGSTGLEREMVAYTLVKPSAGSYFFAGECQFVSLTAPLQQSLGSRYDSVMENIIGVTGANEIVALVEGPPPAGTASADISTVLNPDSPPPEGARPATLTVPGFKSCSPFRSPSCVGVWVNMDFYAQLTHDASVRYPEELGLPECPPPSPDPGFAPGQDVPDKVLDSAPTCAVHPRYAVTELLMVRDSANSFIAAYGCGGSSDNVCERKDLPR